MCTETTPLAPGEDVVESFATDSTQWNLNGYVAVGAAALTLVAGVVVRAAIGMAVGFFLMVVLVLIGGVMFVPFIGGLRLGSTGPVLPPDGCCSRRSSAAGRPSTSRRWPGSRCATTAGTSTPPRT